MRVNVADFSGHSPLYCAVRDGNEPIVRILVEQGKANVDFYGKTNNKEPETDMYDCENEEERLMVEGLECSLTPLHVACLLGYKSIVYYLLTSGKANPNAKGRRGYNSLWFCVLGKQPEIIQHLMVNTEVDFDSLSTENFSLLDLISKVDPSYVSDFEKLVNVV